MRYLDFITFVVSLSEALNRPCEYVAPVQLLLAVRHALQHEPPAGMCFPQGRGVLVLRTNGPHQEVQGVVPSWPRLLANGKRLYLGTFATREEATSVARKARQELHGEYGYAAQDDRSLGPCGL
jgi:hypothetical protein